ncbi:hypothetical protein PG985_013115 [Apiospora marii]|uniref:MYND-type domain-containing protein n=1 Tax=Apiospora marii TaxID=335849 RepID=A0ABR1R9M3_9PEZI
MASLYTTFHDLRFFTSFNDPIHDIRWRAMSAATNGPGRRWHWCVLATVERIDYVVSDGIPNPTIVAQDRWGWRCQMEIDVHNNHDISRRVMQHCQIGMTVAIFYPPEYEKRPWLLDSRQVLFFNLDMGFLLRMSVEFADSSAPECMPRVCCECGAVREGSRMKKCGDCLTFAYCDPDCQANGSKDWAHQRLCPVLADPNVKKMLQLQYITDDPNLISFEP